MTTNPISPLSGKPLSECDDAEVNAWVAKLKGCTMVEQDDGGWMMVMNDGIFTFYRNGPDYTHNGNAALSLMQDEAWPLGTALYKLREGWSCGWETPWVIPTHATPAQAIARAFIIAKENKP